MKLELTTNKLRISLIHTFDAVNDIRKIIFLPITLVYSLILKLRHFLFDLGIFKTQKHSIYTIGVGNLALGGTGKTPLTCFLAEHFSKSFSVAIVSRGYGRKTKGLVIANSNSTAQEIGDEPMIYLKKFPQVKVVVCEKRNVAVHWLSESETPPDLIILDDCMQHRSISVNTLLLTTTEKSPYWKDFLIPSGNLRDVKSAAKLADAIVITKSSSASHSVNTSKPVFSSFSEFNMSPSLNSNSAQGSEFVIFSGIAKNLEFLKAAELFGEVNKAFSYADHHQYSDAEIEEVVSHCNAKNISRVVTTEKDFMRLTDAQLSLFSKVSLEVLEMKLGFYEEVKFLEFLENRISENV